MQYLYFSNKIISELKIFVMIRFCLCITLIITVTVGDDFGPLSYSRLRNKPPECHGFKEYFVPGKMITCLQKCEFIKQ